MNSVLWLALAAVTTLDSRVDAVFKQYDRPDSPGCAVGIYRDGHLAYAKGYGAANLEHGVPVTADTVFYVGSVTLVIKRRATGYSPTEKGGYEVDMPNLTTTGSGSLYTTVKDLALWDESFYTFKLGGRDLTTLVETPGLLENGTRLTYAFGLTVDQQHSLRRVEHAGALVGYRAQMTRYPEKHFTVTVLCNVGSARPGELAARVAEIHLGLPPETADSSSPTEPLPYAANDLEAYHGVYESSELGVRFTLAGGEALLLKRWRFEDETLRPLSRDEFRSSLGILRFERDPAGEVAGFRISTDRTRNLRWEKRGASPNQNP